MGRRVIRARGVLVVCEIALAVVLLTGAGLLVRSLIALHRVDLGFQPENVLVMRATGVRTPAENNAFFGALLPRIAALPGVVAVGATSIPPGDLSYSGDGSYFIDRVPESRDRNLDPRALFTIVAPGAFAALGIPLKEGRDFSESDTADSPLVAIVNEALVRKALPGQNPIGRTIFCSWDRKGGMTIVGVVGDVRQRNPALEPMPDCYMPYTQHNYNSNTLMLVTRTVGDPTALAGSVRRAAAEIAPDVPVSFTTMEATLSKRVEEPRFRALLLSVFAGLAVCLAMVGRVRRHGPCREPALERDRTARGARCLTCGCQAIGAEGCAQASGAGRCHRPARRLGRFQFVCGVRLRHPADGSSRVRRGCSPACRRRPRRRARARPTCRPTRPACRDEARLARFPNA